MLYFSPEYVFVFLPLTICAYFAAHRWVGTTCAKAVLIAASLLFYGIWNLSSVPVLALSIFANYGFVRALDSNTASRRTVLIVGLVFNVGMLAFFKYTNFLISNAAFFGADIKPINLILPLGISFFTFQKIGLLVDVYKFKVKRPSFLNFALFVSFFPQLIAGPIVHHSEIMPQFDKGEKYRFNVENFTKGAVLFIIGFFKKLFIADYMGIYADSGFSNLGNIGFINSWVAALSYTFQIYFDFSGFIDMGIGSAMMLNIMLPQNFLSPYKASNIQEFWRRWHITLGRFLRDYVYIPLGGNQRHVFVNLLVTFFIGGVWHGAAWTFVLWGVFHGIGLCVHRIFQMTGRRLPRSLGILFTFWFVVCGWVFFRAETIGDAWTLLQTMHDPHQLYGMIVQPSIYLEAARKVTFKWILMLLACFVICWRLPNSHEIIKSYRPRYWHIPTLSTAAMASFIFAAYFNVPPPFLYFNF
jgi:alginate O-acetyltransferase complex protein AlgI